MRMNKSTAPQSAHARIALLTSNRCDGDSGLHDGKRGYVPSRHNQVTASEH